MALGPKELGSWANDSNLTTEIRAGNLGKSRKFCWGDTETAATDGTYGTYETYGGLRLQAALLIVPRIPGDRGVMGVTSSDDGRPAWGLGLGSKKGLVGLVPWFRAAVQARFALSH